jgi:hypothetical protein
MCKHTANTKLGTSSSFPTSACSPPLQSPPVSVAAPAVLAAAPAVLAGGSMRPRCPWWTSIHRGLLYLCLSLAESESAPEQWKIHLPATVSIRVAWDRKALVCATCSSFWDSRELAVQIAQFELLLSSTVGCCIFCVNYKYLLHMHCFWCLVSPD